MTCTTHEKHDSHTHGRGCGHTPVAHEDHTDYLHDGHLHYLHGDHVDEHRLAVSNAHPTTCTSGHDCTSHATGHAHGAECGHEAVPHEDHLDYLVAGHLHHAHSGHCDDHGRV
jgi:hypothetical protein